MLKLNWIIKDCKTAIKKTEEHSVSVLDRFFQEKMGKNWNELIAFVQANPVLLVLKTIVEALRPWNQFSEDDERNVDSINQIMNC